MTAATLANALDTSCRRWPDRIAVTQGDRAVTYAELGRRITDLAQRYRRLGVAPHDRVICALPNTAAHIVAMGAAWACGAIHVGADHQLTGKELAWLARHTGAAALVFLAPSDEDARRAIRAVRDAHPATRILVPERGSLGARCASLDDAAADEVGAPATVPGPEAAAWRGPSPEDPAVIFFTSGTTGIPKGPMGHHGDLFRGWSSLARRLDMNPRDVHLGHLPLAHGFGMSLAFMALSTGGRLVMMERFSPREALRLVGGEHVTVLSGTPSHFILLTDQLDAGHFDVATLRVGVGSAASFPPQLLRRIFDGLGMGLMLMYGSSEGVGVVTTDREEMLQGAVGRPVPGFVAVVGPDHRSLSPGEIGEIAFNRGIADVRYWSAEPGSDEPSEGGGDEAAKTSPPAGWYYSGDLGRLDAQGRLYVLGRLKHQIDRGGIKVDPGEVEEALVHLPDILDAAVVGVPNPVLGQVVCAMVVATGAEQPRLEDLRSRLAEGLAAYKLPEELRIVETIPRTTIGKIDRAALPAHADTASDRESLHAR